MPKGIRRKASPSELTGLRRTFTCTRVFCAGSTGAGIGNSAVLRWSDVRVTSADMMQPAKIRDFVLLSVTKY